MMRREFVVIFLSVCLVTACAGTGGTKAAVPEERTGDDDRTGDSREECLRSIKRARLDARSGTYRMYVFGRDRYDARFSRFLGEYMRTKYRVELIMLGGDSRDRDKCYSNEMDKIIYNTFGPDILARAEQEARELFNSDR